VGESSANRKPLSFPAIGLEVGLAEKWPPDRKPEVLKSKIAVLQSGTKFN